MNLTLRGWRKCSVIKPASTPPPFLSFSAILSFFPADLFYFSRGFTLSSFHAPFSLSLSPLIAVFSSCLFGTIQVHLSLSDSHLLCLEDACLLRGGWLLAQRQSQNMGWVIFCCWHSVTAGTGSSSSPHDRDAGTRPVTDGNSGVSSPRLSCFFIITAVMQHQCALAAVCVHVCNPCVISVTRYECYSLCALKGIVHTK